MAYIDDDSQKLKVPAKQGSYVADLQNFKK